jgi:hypothetical protein
MFNGLAILSLLLCVATMVLWVRSYDVQPPPSSYSDRWLYDEGYASIYRGEFTFVYYDTVPRPAQWFQVARLNTRPLQISQWTGGSGWNKSWWYTSVNVRLWLVCVVFAIPSLTWVARLLKRPRLPGICQKCGYDLRATPDRCPECGTVQAKAKIPN